MLRFDPAKERKAMRTAKYDERVDKLRKSIRSALGIETGETCLFVARRASAAVFGKRRYDYTALDGRVGDVVTIAGMNRKGIPGFVREAFQKLTKVIYYNDRDIIGTGIISRVDGDSVQFRLNVTLDNKTRDNIRFERDNIYEMFKSTPEFDSVRVATAATIKYCTVCKIIGATVERGDLTNSFAEILLF
jgi:hypothetical protein